MLTAIHAFVSIRRIKISAAKTLFLYFEIMYLILFTLDLLFMNLNLFNES